MREKVEKSLEKIRALLKADGGNIELIEVMDEGTVKIRLQGACQGCPMSQITLKESVERILKEDVPEVKKVEAV